MTQSGHSDPQAGVREAAAAWSVRLAAEPSEADIDAFEAWIAESPAHFEAFNDAEELMALISDNSAGPELLAMRSEALDRTLRANRKRWLGGVTVNRRQLAAMAAGLIAAPLGIGWWLMQSPKKESLTTGVGEQRTVTLSDGSRITMDAMTEVQVAYSRDLRLIELVAGRALFNVAKDASRPLRVRAGSRAVTALGTAFSIDREATGMLVTLIEGRVAVSDPREAAPIEMKAHQELHLTDTSAPVLSDGVDTGRALAWRDGQVVFDDVALAAAVARMNTYSRLPIVIEDSDGAKLGRLRISGVFTAGDSMSFAEAMGAYFDFAVTRSDKAITLRAGSDANVKS